jgi:hypothetical protein
MDVVQMILALEGYLLASVPIAVLANRRAAVVTHEPNVVIVPITIETCCRFMLTVGVERGREIDVGELRGADLNFAVQLETWGHEREMNRLDNSRSDIYDELTRMTGAVAPNALDQASGARSPLTCFLNDDLGNSFRALAFAHTSDAVSPCTQRGSGGAELPQIEEITMWQQQVQKPRLKHGKCSRPKNFLHQQVSWHR